MDESYSLLIFLKIFNKNLDEIKENEIVVKNEEALRFLLTTISFCDYRSLGTSIGTFLVLRLLLFVTILGMSTYW